MMLHRRSAGRRWDWHRTVLTALAICMIIVVICMVWVYPVATHTSEGTNPVPQPTAVQR